MSKLLIGLSITAALILGLNWGVQYESYLHEHNSYKLGDGICIRGAGYFPYGMPEPSDFMVCGEIVNLEVPPNDDVRFLY